MTYRDDLEAATKRAEAAEKRVAELEAGRPKPARRLWSMLAVLAGVGVLAALVMIVCVLVAIGESTPSPRRTTPCYFVRHYEDKDFDDANGEPWKPWNVYKSRCSGCENRQVNEGEFASKAQAWAFIQYWHLEACK